MCRFNPVNVNPSQVTLMQTLEHRKTKRYVQDAQIAFFFLNRTEEHSAVARNFSRSGMYFETDRPLAVRTLIGIHAKGCGPAHPSDGAEDRRSASSQTPGDLLPEERGCIHLKSLVVAEVKRCELTHGGAGRYGIGVHFVSPAV
jgi:hypothetical protein